MSTVSAVAPIRPGAPDDPYYYGFRDVPRQMPDGKWKTERFPLTLEDCLHPQMGDIIVESTLHDDIRAYLKYVFRELLASNPGALVLSNTGVFWDDPQLEHHAPDVAVILEVSRQRENWKSFHVEVEKTRPSLIVEVVSTNTRKNDVETKVEEYHLARVRNYVIIDNIGDEWRLLGYQYSPAEYLPMPTDHSGRLWLEPVGAYLGLKGTRPVCYDGKTGQEIGDYSAAVAKAAAETARADLAVARAEAEAAARRAAEERIRELEEQLKRKNA